MCGSLPKSYIEGQYRQMHHFNFQPPFQMLEQKPKGRYTDGGLVPIVLLWYSLIFKSAFVKNISAEKYFAAKIVLTSMSE